MKGFSKLSSYIVGLVFLLSSFAKASDSGYFASVLLQYGSPYMQFLAPFIILTEAFLGLLLLFFPKTRLFSVFQPNISVHSHCRICLWHSVQRD